MKVLLSGGGTGGHITPILAVAHELKKLQSNCTVIYIGERGSKFAALTDKHESIDGVHAIFAGKFRRYHNESWLRRLVDVKTNLLNVRDCLYFLFGFMQSLGLINGLKPDVVFLKGSYVGLPVGLSAAVWRRPIITHDSDTLPGLANRIAGRWAVYHATGMPAEFYGYPKDKIRFLGTPLSSNHVPVSSALQEQYRRELKLPEKGRVLFITGGSTGAENINRALATIAYQLLQKYPDLTIIHQVGEGKTAAYNDITPNERLIVVEFVKDMFRYSAVADLIVTRGGATNIAEFAAQAKACLVIPNPLLTGGHQLINAKHLADQDAIAVFDEDDLGDSHKLIDKISGLLDSPDKLQELAHNLGALARPKAAEDIARLLLETASNKKYV